MLALAVPVLIVQTTVFVNAGTLTSTMCAELSTELEQVETTTLAEADVDLRVSLLPVADHLAFIVANGEGAPLIERELNLDNGPRPAVRVAVLLTAEAVNSLTRVVARKAAPHPGPWVLIAGVGGEWWSTPSMALPAIYVGSLIDLGAMEVSVALIASGLDCCTLDLAGAIQGRPLLLGSRAEIGFRFLDSGAIRASTTLGFGAAWRSLAGLVLAFAGPGVTEPHDGVEISSRGGLALDFEPGRIGFRLAGGAQARLTRVTIRVPDGYPSAGEPLDPGVVTPWLEIGVRWHLR